MFLFWFIFWSRYQLCVLALVMLAISIVSIIFCGPTFVVCVVSICWSLELLYFEFCVYEFESIGLVDPFSIPVIKEYASVNELFKTFM